MNSDKISIIITCFNQSHLIENAIISVIEQTHSNWECIIVDDGSTDGSDEIIKKFIHQDTRLHYIYQQNSGVSAARNTGFKFAKGNFIQLLDGDDWLEITKLEKQLNYFAENSDIDVCITNHRHFFEKTKKTISYQFEAIKKKPLDQFLNGWYTNVAFPLHAALYRKSIWKETELPFPQDYNKREEDWVFNVTIALKDVNYGYLDEVLCTYYIGINNFTNSVINSCVNAIEAAFYIKDLLSENEKQHFLNQSITRSICRYHESKISTTLRNSKNWLLGYYIAFPINYGIKIFKRLNHHSR